MSPQANYEQTQDLEYDQTYVADQSNYGTSELENATRGLTLNDSTNIYNETDTYNQTNVYNETDVNDVRNEVDVYDQESTSLECGG